MQKIFREFKSEIIFKYSQELDFPAHIHEDIELVYVKRGSGTAFCDGKKYTLSENSFFITFPNQVHSYKDCENGEYILLIIKPHELLDFNNAFLEGTPVFALWSFKEDNDDNTVYLLKSALNEYIRDGYSAIIKAYLTAFFGKLLKFYEIGKSSVNYDTVLKILNYCTEHYKENISVDSVSKELNVSRSSVSHIFSSRLSINFCDYINSLRLTDAVHMLKNKKYSITEISYMSGFSTIRTFNRAFIKRYGMSPSAYRKNEN